MRWLLTFGLLSVSFVAHAADLPSSLKVIKSVTREGAGNAEAQTAWKSVVSTGGDALLPTLAAMDDANTIASNWLRSAVNAIAEKHVADGKKLPAKELETFVLDSKHGPVGRRLAYELLTEADPKAPERLLPGFLNDPSADLRRDAIAAKLPGLEKTAKTDPKSAKAGLVELFNASRDQDQAEAITKILDTLGDKPNLTTHFGVITKWMVVGPFDSTRGQGFDKAYPPEAGVDLKATYKSKEDKDITWKAVTSTDTYGLVNLNTSLAKFKDSAAYAYTVVESDQEQQVELRFGSYCAVKIFVNGKPTYAREEYHHGERFDQYVATTTLKKGKNEILVKVCQNNQTEPWAQNWQFMFRICDKTGGAVKLNVVELK